MSVVIKAWKIILVNVNKLQNTLRIKTGRTFRSAYIDGYNPSQPFQDICYLHICINMLIFFFFLNLLLLYTQEQDISLREPTALNELKRTY